MAWLAWLASSPLAMVGLLLSVVLATYLVVVCLLLGARSLQSAQKRFKSKNTKMAKIQSLVQRREMIQYHMDWARARGEFDEARAMQRQLAATDEEIDAFEQKYAKAIDSGDIDGFEEDQDEAQTLLSPAQRLAAATAAEAAASAAGETEMRQVQR